MDKLILGIVSSKQSFQVKEAFLEKISTAAGSGNKDACNSVLKTCLVILYPIQKSDDDAKDLLICDRVERLLLSWVESNLELSIEFVQNFILSAKLKEFNDLWTKCQHIRMLQHLLKVLRGVTSDGYVEFKNYVKEYLLTEIFEVDNNIGLLSTFSLVFLQNPELMPTKGNFEVHTQLIQLVVKIVAESTYVNPNKIEGEQVANMNCIEAVSELFKNCIDTDINFMKYAASLVFKEISNLSYKPSANLSTLLAHLKCDILRESLEDSLLTVQDLSVASILIQLLDWFYFSEAKTNIDAWIMIMMEFLIRHEKFNILIPVIMVKVNQICELIYNPLFRKQAVTVLTFMLMSCNKNPNPFHKLLSDFPALMIHLKNDGSESAIQSHHTLVELLFTLMYKFPGFDEMYAPLNALLEGHEKPPLHVMKMWLGNFGTFQDDVSVITMEHMHPVETGLRNLGNTCYMNSMIQALFNLVLVRRKMLMTSYKKIIQPISINLQNIFAFLHLSKRTSIEPKEFFSVSRPSWFQPGSQQDCSEYLKHLLDKLQQESNEEVDKIDDLFNGEINATVECLHCHSCSHQKEVFNDLPLSFKDTDNKGSHGIVHGSSLKGGDSSDILDSKKVHFELDDTTKGNVKTSLESDSNMAASDMITQSTDLSIIDLMNSYFLPELLKDTNQYFCDVCETLQDAYKSMKIAKFPKYLILTLKRFTYNVFTKKRSKILEIIKYPPMFSICNGCDSCYQTLGTHENTVLTFTSETDCQSSTKYRMSSVIVHSGITSDSGHYYCFSCRYTNDNYSWYLMNDEEVKLVSDDCISSQASKFSRETPYVCIYEQIEPVCSVQIDVPEHLIEMVETDNQLYLHEKIIKSKKSQKTLVLNSSLKNDKKDSDNDDDDSHGSIGPCGSGGGGGNGWAGARFVC